MGGGSEQNLAKEMHPVKRTCKSYPKDMFSEYIVLLYFIPFTFASLFMANKIFSKGIDDNSRSMYLSSMLPVNLF